MLSLISFPMNSCNAAMAGKWSKDKHPTTDTTKQLIKQEPASSAAIANYFTALGTIHKPNFSTMLASSYDPYAMVPANQSIKAIFSKNPPMLLNMLKNNTSKTCFPLNPIEL